MSDYRQQTQLLTDIDLGALNQDIDLLNEDGWQVHTFNSIAVMGAHGVATVHHFVVMTYTYVDDPESEEETEEEGQDAENVVPMRLTGSD